MESLWRSIINHHNLCQWREFEIDIDGNNTTVNFLTIFGISNILTLFNFDLPIINVKLTILNDNGCLGWHTFRSYSQQKYKLIIQTVLYRYDIYSRYIFCIFPYCSYYVCIQCVPSEFLNCELEHLKYVKFPHRYIILKGKNWFLWVLNIYCPIS